MSLSLSAKRARAQKKYGEHNNVELSDDEYGRLAERMGVSNRNSYIEKLSDYMAATGKRYQSHYATIRNWFRQDGGTKPSYDMDEFLKRAEQLPVYKSNKEKKKENTEYHYRLKKRTKAVMTLAPDYIYCSFFHSATASRSQRSFSGWEA